MTNDEQIKRKEGKRKSARGDERRGEARRGQDRAEGKRRERQKDEKEGSDPRGALMCRACLPVLVAPCLASLVPVCCHGHDGTGQCPPTPTPTPHPRTLTHPPHLSKTTNKCGASLLVPLVAVFAVSAVRCCGTYIRATTGEATPGRVVGQSTNTQAGATSLSCSCAHLFRFPCPKSEQLAPNQTPILSIAN